MVAGMALHSLQTEVPRCTDTNTSCSESENLEQRGQQTSAVNERTRPKPIQLALLSLLPVPLE